MVILSPAQRISHLRLILTITFAVLGLGHSPASAIVNFTTDTAGGGQAHENHQPAQAINFLISLVGDVPPRDSGDPPVTGDPMMGEITMFAGNYAPFGWAQTNGQLLTISTNVELFSVLGTIYGGDGRTSLGLPDLRSRSPLHFGSGPGLTSHNIGAKFGVETVTLAESQMPSHTHPIPSLGIDTFATGNGQAHENMMPSLAINYFLEPSTGIVRMGGFNYTPFGMTAPGVPSAPLPDIRGRLVMGAGQGPGLTNRNLGDQVGVEQVTLTESTMPVHSHGGADPTGDTGGGQAHENMQPTSTLRYIIAVDNTTPLLGEIRLFAGSVAPTGWDFAEGQIEQISSNRDLFGQIGTLYGGDGRTSFALPDFRGRVPVHYGQGPGLRHWNLGERHGQEAVQLTLNQLPGHDHDYIPEPASLALLGLGGVVVLWRRTRAAG